MRRPPRTGAGRQECCKNIYLNIIMDKKQPTGFSPLSRFFQLYGTFFSMLFPFHFGESPSNFLL